MSNNAITSEVAQQIVTASFQNLAAILGRDDVSITNLMNREETRTAAVNLAVELAISTMSRCGDELGTLNTLMSEK